MARAARPAPARFTVVAWPGLDLSVLAGPDYRLGRAQRTATQSASLDTSDHRLARAGVVVDRVGDEWLVRCGGYGAASFSASEGQVPAELVAALAGVARGAPLVPIVRVRRTGRSLTVSPVAGPDDEPLVAGRFVDEDVTVLDGRRVVFRQRYVAVEGDAAFVEHVRTRLAALGMADRVVDPDVDHVALGPPDPIPWPLEDASTAATVIQRALARSVARLLAHDPVVRLDLHVEGVHQMRVATRRLRSDLRTFSSFLTPEGVAALVDDLRWLAGLLGAVRDPDVLRGRLERAIDRLDDHDRRVGAPLLRRLVRERDAALGHLHEALDSERYHTLVARLVATAEHPPLVDEAHAPALEALVPRARRAWRALRRAARTAALPEATIEDVHEMRIRAKRFRYAVDALVEIEPRARAHAERLSVLQDVLGDLNDAAVAERWLRRAAEHSHEPQRMFVLGQLVMTQRLLVEEALAAWPTAWRPVRRPRRRAWLQPG
jgi:CHAD domain-containing protein